MNNKALKTLEYTKIIEMLAAHASSPLGKIRCEDLLPPVHRERLNISRNRLRMPCPVCFRKETSTSAVPKISAVP